MAPRQLAATSSHFKAFTVTAPGAASSLAAVSALTKIAKSGDVAPIGTFDQGGFLDFGFPAISGDTVAFSGNYGNGSGEGIFTGNGGPLTTVIKTGDSLFDSTVASLSFTRFGLDPDGSGNLAFSYSLADGRSGIAMATPVIEPGTSQDNPILPSNPGGSPFLFENALPDKWFDPPFVPSFTYTAQPGTLFSQILDFPTGFSDPFTVAVQGSTLGQFGPGESVSFAGFPSGGVSEFTVSGIDPLVDAEDPRGFPLQIGFTTSTGSFIMTAVPEPGGLLLVCLTTVLVSAVHSFHRKPYGLLV